LQTGVTCLYGKKSYYTFRAIYFSLTAFAVMAYITVQPTNELKFLGEDSGLFGLANIKYRLQISSTDLVVKRCYLRRIWRLSHILYKMARNFFVYSDKHWII